MKGFPVLEARQALRFCASSLSAMGVLQLAPE